MERLGANYQKTGPGILRNIPQEDLDEIRRIFDETGGTERFRKIEEYSEKKAGEMGLQFDESRESEYFRHVYRANEKKHTPQDEH
jgi:heterodisulfide reductase subunit C